MTIPFTLPLPPSVNNAFINVRGRGRVKSPHYREWEREAVVAMLGTAHPTLSKGAKWELTATCVMPNWRKQDLDNKAKVTVDFLAWRLGLDDNLLMALALVKEVVKGESYITGEVRVG